MRYSLLLLVVSAVVGAHALAPVPGAMAPLAQVDEEQVRQVVRLANSDAVYGAAYRTNDPAPLRRVWAGEALVEMVEDLEVMAGLGQYLDLSLEDLQFRRIDQLGASRVRAVTLERWLARLYQTGGTYVGYQRQIVENRYLLERRGDDWFVIEADQEIQGGDPSFRPGEPPVQ